MGEGPPYLLGLAEARRAAGSYHLPVTRLCWGKGSRYKTLWAGWWGTWCRILSHTEFSRSRHWNGLFGIIVKGRGQKKKSSCDAGLTKPWPRTGSSGIAGAHPSCCTKLDGSSHAFTLPSRSVMDLAPIGSTWPWVGVVYSCSRPWRNWLLSAVCWLHSSHQAASPTLKGLSKEKAKPRSSNNEWLHTALARWSPYFFLYRHRL